MKGKVIEAMARAIGPLWKVEGVDIAKAAYDAIEAMGCSVVYTEREFICKKCYTRTDEGKPENYHPF